MPLVFVLHESGNNLTVHDLLIDRSSCWEYNTNLSQFLYFNLYLTMFHTI